MERVSLRDIRPNPFQSRKRLDADAVGLLAEEIKRVGLWQPLRVRAVNGNYELVVGHQRLDAMRQLGRKEVEVEVVKLTDLDMAQQSLIENLQRTGLADMDKAEAIARLHGMLVKAGKLPREAADELCRLLGYKTPVTIKDFLEMAELSPAAKATVRASNMPRTAVRVAQKIGGEAMITHAAKNDLGRDELDPMLMSLTGLESKARAKVTAGILKREVTDPGEVKRMATRERQKAAAPEEKMPPDLLVHVVWMTRSLEEWEKRLQQVKPHKAYIHGHPTVFNDFRHSAERFIRTLQEILNL